MSIAAMILGGLIVSVAGFLAGTTGFGFALISTPLLLLTGLPLRFVVTVNLALVLVTRVPPAYQFWRHIDRRRVLILVLGSVPGFYLGIQVMRYVEESLLKVTAGILIMLVALALARAADAPPPPKVPGHAALAGLAGGFLGTSTSLSGIPPALMLAGQKTKPLSFVADLAVYFVAANSIALGLLAMQGTLSTTALQLATPVWLPGALLGTYLGTTVAPRIPEKLFRNITLLLLLLAGGSIVLSAL